MSDYYELLQVPRDADLNAIKSAYRRLARQYHPDSNKSHIAAEHMKLLNAAYDTLSDPLKRQEYDDLLVAEVLNAQAYAQAAHTTGMRSWLIWIGMTALLVLAALTGTLFALRGQLSQIVGSVIATPTHVAVAVPPTRTPQPTFTNSPTPTATPSVTPSATPSSTATPTPRPTVSPSAALPYPLPSAAPGSRVVFAEVTNSTSGANDIFVSNIDGSNKLNLTRSESLNEQSPSWSPQGNYVVFGEINSGNLLVASVEGNQLIRLTADPVLRDSNPVWAPTGTLIAFSAIARADLANGLLERAKVHVIDFNTRQRRLVADQPGRDLTWSPDGRWLAYQVPSASGSTLYVTTAAAERVGQPYYAFSSRIRRIAWTTDSQKVLYETLSGTQTEIWVMTLQPFSLQRLSGALTVVSARGRFPGATFEGEIFPPLVSTLR